MSKEQGSESAVSRSQFIEEEKVAEEKEAPKRLSRKDFVKGAAAVAGAGALASCAPAATPAPAPTCPPAPECPPAAECAPCPTPWIPETWDKEADVVVVGTGAAALSAAIQAHDGEANVLVLEKAPEEEEGGNSRACGNLVFHPTDVDKAIAYQTALNDLYIVPEDIVAVWAEEMFKNADWMRSLGGDPQVGDYPSMAPEFPGLPGADCVEILVNNPDDPEPSRVWRLLKANVVERGIEVLYETPAKELIQDALTGAILGVIAEQSGERIAIKAKKAVVLACGGYENNQEMGRDYVPNQPYAYPKGTPYNTGDGITMAVAVGADLWHMNSFAGPAYVFKRPDVDYVEYASWPDKSYIYVGADGTRFTAEAAGTHAGKHGKIDFHGQWVPGPTPVPMHLICDEDFVSKGPICKAFTNHMGWNNIIVKTWLWSDDNSVEIEKGWIIKADTIRELAGKIDQSPDVLEETVSTYNQYCAAGEDLEFGRGPATLKPIAVPPYYALPLVPGYTNTQGGPRRNAEAHIVRPDRTPIPRLYSAGELGSVYSFCYQGGGNMGECLAFGRIAGRNAAAEEPWA